MEIAIKQLKIGDNTIENLETEDQVIITKKFVKEASKYLEKVNKFKQNKKFF